MTFSTTRYVEFTGVATWGSETEFSRADIGHVIALSDFLALLGCPVAHHFQFSCDSKSQCHAQLGYFSMDVGIDETWKKSST